MKREREMIASLLPSGDVRVTEALPTGWTDRDYTRGEAERLRDALAAVLS